MSRPFLSDIESQDDAMIVSFNKEEYEGYVNATQTDRERQERNLKMYSGVNYGQWDAEAAEVLINDNRPINTFNFIQRVVDQILGVLEENPLAVYYDPTNPESVDEFNLLQELYDYDYEAGDWESELHDFKRNGLIYQGVLEYKQDFKRSRLGNIGIKNINPSTIIFDPKNQEYDTQKCRAAFKYTWMSARDIAEKFDITDGEIRQLLKNEESLGGQLDQSFDQDQLNDRHNDLYYDATETRFKVIERIYMQTISAKRLFDNRKGSFMAVDSPELMETLMNLPGSSFSIKNDNFNICKVVTFAPGISNSLILAKGDHPIQIGRLPFERFSAKNIHGQLQGVVDQLVDAQVAVNKRESLLDFFGLTAANGTSFIADNLFNDESEKERYFREKNKPGADDFEVDGDVLSSGHGQMAVDRGEYPRDLAERVEFAKNFIQEMDVNDALKGQAAGGRESQGALAFKAERGLSGFESLNKGLKKAVGGLGSAYFYLAKQFYGDMDSKIGRVFKNSKKNKTISINQSLEDGTVINSIKEMKRQNVMVRESTSGQKKKREFLSKYSEAARTWGNPLMQAYFEGKQIEYFDLPENEQEEAKRLTQRYLKHLEIQLDGQDAEVLALIEQTKKQGVGQGPAEAANAPGMGALPDGVGGGQTDANNQSPSDFTG